MTDKIKQAYLQNIALAANPEYFLPEMFCALGTELIDFIIPDASSLDPKVASLDTGAPPLQQVSPSDGGAEFPRQEYNGILRLLSSIVSFQNKGGLFTFNENNTVGYKNGAVLYDYATNRLVKSLKDNNTANFVTDPTNINNVDWGFITVTPAMLDAYGKLSANNTWTGLNSFSQIFKVAGINTQGAGIIASGATTDGSWVKFANGYIIQRFGAIIPSGVVTPITLPTDFTNTFYDVQMTSRDVDTNTSSYRWAAAPKTLTVAEVFQNSGFNISFSFIAVGY